MPVELVWREDDESPVLRRFLEVATPVAGTGSRIVKAGSSTCSSGPIESA